MSGGCVFCPFCSSSTWLEDKNTPTETVGGVRITIDVKEGFCEKCGRKMCEVTVTGIQEELDND